MIRRLGGLIAVILGGLAVAPAVAAADTTPELHLVDQEVLSEDGRLQGLVFQTPAVPGTDVRVRVLLPEGYDDPDQADRAYPMLLLLHGMSGDSSDWTTMTDLVTHAGARDLIVVMPDGGSAGFYADWADGPQWETFHTRQLIDWVDDGYRTVGTREGRGIAGLSMGGYGALVYAARNPDLFVATASFSGAVNIADGEIAAALALELLGIADDRRWGPFLTDEVTWRDHNPPDLATNLPPMSIGLWVGNGVPNPANGDRLAPPVDPIEAGIYAMNTLTTLRFTAQGVPHRYIDYGLGTHEWHYWEAGLHEWLPMFRAAVADPPPPPEAFRYRTAEPSFDVWGWSFTADRDVKEFLDLTEVSTRGLTARGSGLIHVTTPPEYEPGAAYLVSNASADDRAVVPLAAPVEPVVVADDAGRLRFTVDLGPSHTDQQNTLAADVAELLPGYWTTRTVSITPSEASAAVPVDEAIAPAPPPSHVDVPALPRTGSSSPSALVIVVLVAAMAARVAHRSHGV